MQATSRLPDYRLHRSAGSFPADCDRHRLQLGAAHLHQLGARAVAEFLAELAREEDHRLALLAQLDEWRATLTPAMVRAAGGHRFPQQLRQVPR